MFNGKRKYLLALAILILAGFCMYFYFAIGNVDSAIVHEKFVDRKFNTNIICDQIDQFVAVDNDWDVYNYQEILSYTISEIDTAAGMYAELFDESLQSISVRTPMSEGQPFMPMNEPLFVEAVRTNERGEMTFLYEAEGIRLHNIYIYYRWVPTNKALQNRMLVVTGISEYAIDTGVASWVIYGAIALLIVASVCIMASAIMLCQLGHIYGQRKGKSKWRNKVSS